MYSEKLVAIVTEYWPKMANSISKKTEYKELLINETSHVNHLNPKIRHRMYCVKHGIETAELIPKCYCGKDCKFDIEYHDNGFTSFCSVTCSRANKRISVNAQRKLGNKEWLYEERITKRRAITDIATELGLSIQPVNDALAHFDIPKIDVKRDVAMAPYVEDREWLIDQYKTQHKSPRTIAIEFGCTESVVEYWLTKHAIEKNPPNSYEREFTKISKGHQEIVDHIRTFYDGPMDVNTRMVIKGEELDIYLPELNLAFEYNGLYYHRYIGNATSAAAMKDHTYHIGKTMRCAEVGCDLYHIWEDDWTFRCDVMKAVIKQKIVSPTAKYQARKLTVGDVSVVAKGTFLDQYHIQGNDRSNYRYGLFASDGQLLSIMTFCKIRYGTMSGAVWELSRYCTLPDVAVIGGFARLLSHFCAEHSGDIVSYSNTCHFKGDVYQNNGFTFVSANTRRYQYFSPNTGKRMSRVQFQKAKIQDGPDDARTERQIMMDRGYHVVFDCGTKTWLYRNPPISPV